MNTVFSMVFKDSETREICEEELNVNHISKLTKRQQAILALMAQGYTNKDIAEHLSISVHTAHNHVRNIIRCLDVPNRTAATTVYWQQMRKNDYN